MTDAKRGQQGSGREVSVRPEPGQPLPGRAASPAGQILHELGAISTTLDGVCRDWGARFGRIDSELRGIDLILTESQPPPWPPPPEQPKTTPEEPHERASRARSGRG